MKASIFYPTTLMLLGLCSAVTHAQSVAPSKVTAEKKSNVHVLDRAEFDVWLTKPEQLLIIDVRRPDEVTAIGGLPVFLSVQLEDLERRLAWIPRERNIVTVSNHSGRSVKAAELLTGKGFKVAGALGVQTYEEQGGKLTRIVPKPAVAAGKPTSK